MAAAQPGRGRALLLAQQLLEKGFDGVELGWVGLEGAGRHQRDLLRELALGPSLGTPHVLGVPEQRDELAAHDFCPARP